MTASKIIARLTAVAPAILDQHSKPHARCVLATRVGIAVLARFNVEADPVIVVAEAANIAYINWLNAGQPDGAAGYHAAGCWLLTNNPNDAGSAKLPSEAAPITGRPWLGHLVLTARGQLIDLDAQQFSRPRHGINPPRAVALPWNGHETIAAFEWGGLRYRRWPATHPLDDFRGASDWMVSGDDLARVVDPIVAAIRKAGRQ